MTGTFLFFSLLVALGVRRCKRAFSGCSKQGLLFIAMHGLLLLWKRGSRLTGFSNCGAHAWLLLSK